MRIAPLNRGIVIFFKSVALVNVINKAASKGMTLLLLFGSYEATRAAVQEYATLTFENLPVLTPNSLRRQVSGFTKVSG